MLSRSRCSSELTLRYNATFPTSLSGSWLLVLGIVALPTSRVRTLRSGRPSRLQEFIQVTLCNPILALKLVCGQLLGLHPPVDRPVANLQLLGYFRKRVIGLLHRLHGSHLLHKFPLVNIVHFLTIMYN